MTTRLIVENTGPGDVTVAIVDRYDSEDDVVFQTRTLKPGEKDEFLYVYDTRYFRVSEVKKA